MDRSYLQAEEGSEQVLWHRIIVIGLILMTVLVPLFFAPIFTEYDLPKLVIVKVLAVSLVLVWMIHMAIEGEIRIVDTPLYYVFIGFLAVNFVSLFQSYNVFQGLDTLFQYLCYFFLVVLVFHVVRRMDQIYWFAVSMAATGSLVAIIGLLQHNKIYDFYARWSVPVSTIGNVNFVAGYYNVVFPVSLALIFALRRFRFQAILLLACFFMACHLVVLGSRGGWLGTIVAGGVLGSAALFRHFRVGRRIVDVTLAFLVVVGLGWPVLGGMLSDVHVASDRTLGGLTQTYWQSMRLRVEDAIRLQDDSSLQRVGLWEDTLRLIFDRPMVGVGVGNFEYNIPKYMSRQSLDVKHRMESQSGIEMMAFRAHNEYLEVWAETGLLGILVFGILLFQIVASLYLLLKQYIGGESDFLVVGFVAAVVATLVHAFFSSNFQDPSSAVHFWLIVGMVWSLRLNIEGRPMLRLLTTGKGQGAFALIAAGGITWIVVVYLGWQTLLGDYYHQQGKGRFYIAQDWSGAETEWKRSVRYFPSKHFEVYQALGTALFNQKKWQEAAGAFQKSLYYHRNNATVYAYLGRSLSESGQFEKAAVSLQRAVELSPMSEGFYLWLGDALGRANNPEAAIVALNQALRLDPNDPDTYWLRGRNLMQMGKPEEAIEAYQKGLALSPKNPELLNSLARAHAEQQDFEAAREIYERLVQALPDHPDYLANLGTVLFILNQYEAAYETCLKVLKMDPDHVSAYAVLGQVLIASEKVDEARQVYREGLRRNPGHQKLQALLEELERRFSETRP